MQRGDPGKRAGTGGKHNPKKQRRTAGLRPPRRPPERSMKAGWKSALSWFVKSPPAWLASVIVLALVGYLQPAFTTYLNGLLPSVGIAESASSPAVKVVNVQNFADNQDIVLPGSVNPDDDRSWLDRRPQDLSRLQEYNATPVDRASWQIALVGQRTQAVKVVDATYMQTRQCSAPLGGALIEYSGPVGQGETVTALGASIDSSAPTLMTSTPEGPRPFFGRNSISLPKDQKTLIKSPLRPQLLGTASGKSRFSIWPTGSGNDCKSPRARRAPVCGHWPSSAE